jgi:hypothetical protein
MNKRILITSSPKKKPLCESHTAVFCLIQAQPAEITDGCWSGKAMLLLEPTQFSLPVPELALPLLLVQELLLASVLVLPLLELLAF